MRLRESDLPADEPPIPLLDMIYDDMVRVRIAPRALEALQDWLGAELLRIVETGEPEGDWPSAAIRVSLAAADDGDTACLLALWPGARPDPRDRSRLEAAARHLTRARRFRAQLVQTRSIGEVFSSGLDRMAIGAMTIRDDGRPVDANRIARRILEQSDGIGIVAGKVCAALPSEQRALRALMAAVADGKVEQGALRISRPSGKPDISLLLLRRPPRAGVIRAGMRILLRDLTCELLHSRNALRDLYGLTDTEAAVTLHLANGLSAEEIELQFGIRHNTLRAHLRSIYAKLDVSSQAELVHSVLTGASVLALEGDAELPPLEPLSPLVH